MERRYYDYMNPDVKAEPFNLTNRETLLIVDKVEYVKLKTAIANLVNHFHNNDHLTKEMFEAILEADE